MKEEANLVMSSEEEGFGKIAKYRMSVAENMISSIYRTNTPAYSY